MLRTLILIFSFFILVGCSSPFEQSIQAHKVTENRLKQYPTTVLCKILKEEPNYEVQSIVVSELEQRRKKCEVQESGTRVEFIIVFDPTGF